jgi:hypothetical protein
VGADGRPVQWLPPMRAVNPMRTRRRATDELRLAIRCLPRATRVAMLEGIAANPIIAGAYSSREGICPMLAAHRAGGRTNLIAFAEAWDRFAQRTHRFRHSRRATERELNFLRAHLEASLMEDDDVPPLGAAIAEHRELVAGRPPVRRRPATWTRLFRRYDEYLDALEGLDAASDAVKAALDLPRTSTLA